MNINFIINLNDNEKQRMTDQCIKEFKQAMYGIKCNEDMIKNIGIEQQREKYCLLNKEYLMDYECQKSHCYCRIGLKNQRALAICDIALALGLTISDKVKRISFYGTECDRIGEEFCKFYKKFPPRKERIDKDKPYYRKLAIYMMCRAGVITKGTRDRMLQLLKTKTSIQLQERTQRKVNKMQEAFVEFYQKIKRIVSPDEAKEIVKESGLHRYMVKKYGNEAVATACCGQSCNTAMRNMR